MSNINAGKNEFRLSQISQAKDLLEKEGYFTGNLWHVFDVQQNSELAHADTLTVLEGAMTGDWITEQIYECIDQVAKAEGHKQREDI